MSDFEPFDDELAGALRRRTAGSPIPTAAAHEAVLRRAGTIRRRRAAFGGGGAMAVLLVGGVLLLPRGAEEQIPAVTGDVLPSFDDTSTTVEPPRPSTEPVDGAAPRSVDVEIPPVSEDSTGSSSSTPSDSVAVVPTPAPTIPRSLPSTSTALTTPSTTTAPTTTPPTSSTTSSTAASTTPSTTDSTPTLAPFTDTYQSTGGAITVNWNGTALSLQAVSPAAGFVADVEDSSATRIRVRFRSDDGDSRIEVRVVDGQLLVDVD